MILMLSAASGADAMLDARVQVLGVLADDDQVDVLVARLDALHRPRGAQIGVQVERLAEGHVDRAKALADGSRDRPLEGDLRGSDRFEHVLGQRRAVFRDLRLAGVDTDPFEGQSGCLENGDRGVGQLGADAIAGDQGDGVGHAGTNLVAQITASALPQA